MQYGPKRDAFPFSRWRRKEWGGLTVTITCGRSWLRGLWLGLAAQSTTGEEKCNQEESSLYNQGRKECRQGPGQILF
uniref:Uncharacterized protein n=1 Tax=Thermogemmatispora argillosa TaxID=2045280 RepID=A0A455SW88_9CHLR|nr:hypothetical protein KTA_01390 [Thermogemmatispora argillosa]